VAAPDASVTIEGAMQPPRHRLLEDIEYYKPKIKPDIARALAAVPHLISSIMDNAVDGECRQHGIDDDVVGCGESDEEQYYW
jgi:hypothetical protein